MKKGFTMQYFEEPKIKYEKRNEAEISLLLPVHNEAETVEKTILEFYNEIGTKIPLELSLIHI